MEKEPLLPYGSPKKSQPSSLPPLLCPLHEDNEITIPPLPMTPSSKEVKDRLIFGSTSSSLSPSSSLSQHEDSTTRNLLEALTLNSPKSSMKNLDNEIFNLGRQRSNIDPENQQSWLIDPNNPASKTNHQRSKSAPSMATISEIDNFPEIMPPQFGKQSSIVRQAVMLLIIYLILGVIIYWFNQENFRLTETYPVVDAIYFCIVTMCTIGYSDITPHSTGTKLFAITFVLVGFGFICILLNGMVSYVLSLQENYLLRTVKGGGAPESGSYIIDENKGRIRIRMKVALALAVVVLCIGIGVMVLHFVENLDWFDSFYLSVVSVTTVGYGEKAFSSLAGRIFASIWLLISTLAVAGAFLYLAEARVEKQQRRMVKGVLGQDMTLAQFLAADIDNDGFVSKSEYVIYKLKEMGMVSENHILEICRQFEKRDAGNSGKISLANLMESYH